MSVQYRGQIPERNFSIHDFYTNEIVITGFGIWRHPETNKRHLRGFFLEVTGFPVRSEQPVMGILTQ